MTNSSRCALYRLYDEFDRLLYVGISDRPWKRFKQHERDKAWWKEVTRQVIEWKYDRAEALAAEGAAIATEAPVFNSARPSGSTDWRVPPDEDMYISADRVNATCPVCGHVEFGWVVARLLDLDVAAYQLQCIYHGDQWVISDLETVRHLGAEGAGWHRIGDVA